MGPGPIRYRDNAPRVLLLLYDASDGSEHSQRYIGDTARRRGAGLRLGSTRFHWLSVAPLLEPLDLRQWPGHDHTVTFAPKVKGSVAHRRARSTGEHTLGIPAQSYSCNSVSGVITR